VDGVGDIDGERGERGVGCFDVDEGGLAVFDPPRVCEFAGPGVAGGACIECQTKVGGSLEAILGLLFE